MNSQSSRRRGVHPESPQAGRLSIIWLVPQKVPWPSSSVHHGGFTPFPETPWRHSPGVPPKKVGRQEPPRQRHPGHHHPDS